MLKRFIQVVLFLSLLPMQAWAGDLKVGQTEHEKYRYRIELANLILRKTASEYGPARIVPYAKTDPTQLRCLRLLNDREVDLVFLPATEELLATLDAIKYDIHCGMLGYRVLIINKEDKERFSKVKTLNDLRQFEGGFGSQWVDFKIFRLNSLPVVGTSSTATLLKMLSAKRFDYFHRGLHEAWAEVENNRAELPTIMVEENLVLVYDFPVYFMFSKDNPELKKRFEKGLDIVLNDGSFKALFIEWFGEISRKVDLRNRTLIRIKYPTPKNLPPIDTSLWLN